MTREERKAINDYLASYRFYFSERKETKNVNCASAAFRAQAFSIYRSVMDMPPSKEKLLLYYHYIRCETLETCAELLGISRRSVFRLKNSALELYAMLSKNDAAIAFLS